MGMLQSSSIIASSSVMAFLRSITARMMASALVMNGVKMPRLSSRRMIFLMRRSTRSQLLARGILRGAEAAVDSFGSGPGHVFRARLRASLLAPGTEVHRTADVSRSSEMSPDATSLLSSSKQELAPMHCAPPPPLRPFGAPAAPLRAPPESQRKCSISLLCP